MLMCRSLSLEKIKCFTYFYRVVTCITALTFFAPTVPLLAVSASGSALAPKSTFKGKAPLFPKPPLFTQEKLLAGTLLWDEFTAMNHGKRPAVIDLSGDEDAARKQFGMQIQNLPDTQLVYLTLEVKTTELDKMDKDPMRPRDVTRHIVVVDSAGVLKKNIRDILKGRGRLNEFHFYLNFGEYRAVRNVHLYRISLDKKWKSMKRLQGKGLMTVPLDRIADIIKTKYPNYTLTAYASNRPAIKHFFESRGMHPQFATRIFDRERREKIYYMIQSYEGYGAAKQDMLIAELPRRAPRKTVVLPLPAPNGQLKEPVMQDRRKMLEQEIKGMGVLGNSA